MPSPHRNFFCKAGWVLSLMLLLWLPQVHAETPVDGEARVAAARRYMELHPIGEILETALNETAKSLSPRLSDKFHDITRRSIRPAVLEKAMKNSLVKIFTAEEIDALADFQKSPTADFPTSRVGKSIGSKWHLLRAEVFPLLQQEMFRAVQLMERENP